MDLQDQRIACLRMAIDMGCTSDTAIRVAMDLMDFVASGTLLSPSKAATADPVAACGTILAAPAAAELTATPAPQVATEPQVPAAPSPPLEAVAAPTQAAAAGPTTALPALEPVLSAAASPEIGLGTPAQADSPPSTGGALDVTTVEEGKAPSEAAAPDTPIPQMPTPHAAPTAAVAPDLASPDVHAPQAAAAADETPEMSAAPSPCAEAPPSQVAEEAPGEKLTTGAPATLSEPAASAETPAMPSPGTNGAAVSPTVTTTGP